MNNCKLVKLKGDDIKPTQMDYTINEVEIC